MISPAKAELELREIRMRNKEYARSYPFEDVAQEFFIAGLGVG